MKHFVAFFLCCISAHTPAESLNIAAASDLRFALDEIIEVFHKQYPDAQFNVIYGSSGKMTTQIMNGAPYDLFFSADISFPQKLFDEGFAVTEPAVYAIGRIVLWSSLHDASAISLADLVDNKYRSIAIAQPSHAPYGLRAKEAMISAGVWQKIQSKLIFGENIAHTAQMAQSGAVDIAIIALSLAKFPTLAEHGYSLISSELHQPLTQGYVVTRHGAEKQGVSIFVRFLETEAAYNVMQKFGFVRPGG